MRWWGQLGKRCAGGHRAEVVGAAHPESGLTLESKVAGFSRVLESAGKQAEAAAATEAALRLFEQKESAPMIARARERLGALTV